MRKLAGLLLISIFLWAQNLYVLKGKSEREEFEFLIPARIVNMGPKVRIGSREINLKDVKEKGKIVVEKHGEKLYLTLNVFVPPSRAYHNRKYTHLKFRVKGEDEISINLPLWFVRALFWFVPHIEFKGEGIDEEEERAGREYINFIIHPDEYIKEYMGPLRIFYVKTEDEIVEMVLD